MLSGKIIKIIIKIIKITNYLKIKYLYLSI